LANGRLLTFVKKHPEDPRNLSTFHGHQLVKPADFLGDAISQ
jgi:hypothetical protein